MPRFRDTRIIIRVRSGSIYGPVFDAARFRSACLIDSTLIEVCCGQGGLPLFDESGGALTVANGVRSWSA